MANRLAQSNSPYLLQHASNPVDWWPWCDEAFAEARRRDVPVFLSIGYSTCYWCHVMERESFESPEIARRMNESFVCIKVDREERPDVDDVYMAAVQAFSGRGGWPMSVFLEPSGRRPFYAGTYFPDEPKPGMGNMPTFPQILDGLSSAWTNQRGDVLEQARQLAEAVRERVDERHEPVKLTVEHVGNAVSTLVKMHDRVNGGFGGAPKFPQPVYLDLLLEFREHAKEGERGGARDAVDAVIKKTLDAMACGGIHDHVGGGFHRYSVDEKWVVPHFEKMLYDNAQLLATYARAYATYNDDLYQIVSWRTSSYLIQYLYLGDEHSAFASAQDAEVNHREGQNYLWTPEEIRKVLSAHDDWMERGYGISKIDWTLRTFGLDKPPNFRDPHHPTEEPRHVLVLADHPRVLAEQECQAFSGSNFFLYQVCKELEEARNQREQPVLDDKVLTSWNGLAIYAEVFTGIQLETAAHMRCAESVAEFILRTMRDDHGGLLRTWRQGRAAIAGFFEDYAFMIHGLLELVRARRKFYGEGYKKDEYKQIYKPASMDWLAEAVALVEQAEQLFVAEDGSYYDTRADITAKQELFVRTRSVYDGALPSPNSVMAHNLLDLAELTGDISYRKRAARLLRALSPHIAKTPAGAANAVRALLRLIVTDLQLLEETFADLPHASSPSAATNTPEVQIEANTDRVEIAPGSPGGLLLRLHIPEGLHINAADPAPGEDPRNVHLVPLKVWIAGGTGCTAYADYPPGEPYGEEGKVRVHNGGTLELAVVIERDAETPWSGTPMLAVQYQLCSDTECSAPTAVELDVSIERK